MKKSHQYYIFFMCFVGMMLAALSASFRGFFVPTFKAEFGIDNTNMGMIISVAQASSMAFAFFSRQILSSIWTQAYYCNRLYPYCSLYWCGCQCKVLANTTRRLLWHGQWNSHACYRTQQHASYGYNFSPCHNNELRSWHIRLWIDCLPKIPWLVPDYGLRLADTFHKCHFHFSYQCMFSLVFTWRTFR